MILIERGEGAPESVKVAGNMCDTKSGGGGGGAGSSFLPSKTFPNLDGSAKNCG